MTAGMPILLILKRHTLTIIRMPMDICTIIATMVSVLMYVAIILLCAETSF